MQREKVKRIDLSFADEINKTRRKFTTSWYITNVVTKLSLTQIPDTHLQDIVKFMGALQKKLAFANHFYTKHYRLKISSRTLLSGNKFYSECQINQKILL